MLAVLCSSTGLLEEVSMDEDTPCPSFRASGQVCLSRPLPAALAPLLKAQLNAVLEKLCAVFPPARACLEAAADGSGSVQLQKLASFRCRLEGLAAVRDEHDGDISAELAEGDTSRPCNPSNIMISATAISKRAAAAG